MYPWLWLWAPQVEFPLSGNVSQDIAPVANLFSATVDPDAGDPSIEQKAFDIASYGKQLGLITEVLIELAEQSLPGGGKSNESLQRLKRIQAAIEKVKGSAYDSQLNDIERNIQAVRRRGGARAQVLGRKLEQLRSEGGA
jgi:hypothetical protein